MAGICLWSLTIKKVAAEKWLAVVIKIHPKFYFWRILKRKNPKLLSLVILEAILKHPDGVSTCLDTLHWYKAWFTRYQIFLMPDRFPESGTKNAFECEYLHKAKKTVQWHYFVAK